MYIDLQNTASYGMKEQNEQRMTDIEDVDSPGMGIRMRTTAPAACYGRNMTFPRPTSSYAHRHELPAIVTEGESCRLFAEVRDRLISRTILILYLVAPVVPVGCCLNSIRVIKFSPFPIVSRN